MTDWITYGLLAIIAITAIFSRKDTNEMRTHVKGIHTSLNDFINREAKKNAR